MSESKENQWKRKYKKNPRKFPDTVSAEIQMGMRKYRPAVVESKIWEEDWHDLFYEVMKIISEDKKWQEHASSQTALDDHLGGK